MEVFLDELKGAFLYQLDTETGLFEGISYNCLAQNWFLTPSIPFQALKRPIKPGFSNA